MHLEGHFWAQANLIPKSSSYDPYVIPMPSSRLQAAKRALVSVILQLQRDLDDLQKNKPRPTKPEYVKRVKAILRSAKAHEVAGNCVASLKQTCQEVSDNEGRASRG